MRNLMTTVAMAAMLTLGSIAVASAAAPVTGIEVVDQVLAEAYSAVEAACAPAGGGTNSAACNAAMAAFAALSDPEELAKVPAVARAIAAGTLSLDQVISATASSTFTDSFLAANTTLNAEIKAANVGNTAFLAAIEATSVQTLGLSTAGGPGEGSATVVNNG